MFPGMESTYVSDQEPRGVTGAPRPFEEKRPGDHSWDSNRLPTEFAIVQSLQKLPIFGRNRTEEVSSLCRSTEALLCTPFSLIPSSDWKSVALPLGLSCRSLVMRVPRAALAACLLCATARSTYFVLINQKTKPKPKCWGAGGVVFPILGAHVVS